MISKSITTSFIFLCKSVYLWLCDNYMHLILPYEILGLRKSPWLIRNKYLYIPWYMLDLPNNFSHLMPKLLGHFSRYLKNNKRIALLGKKGAPDWSNTIILLITVKSLIYNVKGVAGMESTQYSTIIKLISSNHNSIILID